MTVIIIFKFYCFVVKHSILHFKTIKRTFKLHVAILYFDDFVQIICSSSKIT
ncbi:hypothetical protein RhiirA4_491265 [Rhizophagus irregularis]|uniref:Uncharacterized protein n=1 Tax=Rhizophagus irregularis TaxID=588596 RepID=A0A2I1HWH1_9GLOM|nr:hypothetical protein RhiirA4_491265 [Rhizophagus irregularis]